MVKQAVTRLSPTRDGSAELVTLSFQIEVAISKVSIRVLSAVARKRAAVYTEVGSGRGSAWLERLVRDQEVGGSNPLAPTNLFN